MDPENDSGNLEYKLKLVSLSNNRFNELCTQMKYRLDEGDNECIYKIGINDNGSIQGLSRSEYNTTYENIRSIVKNVNASIINHNMKEFEKNLFIGDILIRKNDLSLPIEITIAVAGNVDGGKSSTIGVLTSGQLDNGRGLARLQIFSHPHEIETGRTSSIAHHLIGFDNSGALVNDNISITKPSWTDIMQLSNKIIYFNDLAGHEKYLRTTIYGFSSIIPDYSAIIVAANTGLNKMTKEHIVICLSLKIPFFIIITKVDMCPDNIYKQTLVNIKRLLKLPVVHKVHYIINNNNSAALCAKNMISDNIVPIIPISNVTGHNLPLLKNFLNYLPSRKLFKNNTNNYLEMFIDGDFHITGIGTVVSGLIQNGTVKVNDSILIGPCDGLNKFIPTSVKSIHYKRIPLQQATAGMYVCLALKKINRKQISNGMVVITENNPIRASMKFTAQISILHGHHTTIRYNYQPFLHINTIRQAARVIKINKLTNIDEGENVLRTGDKAIINFKFLHKPEYIKPNFKIIFRENNIRVIGIITEIL